MTSHPVAMKLRTANLDDSRAITELINRAFLVERFFVDHDRISEEEVRSLLGRGGFTLAEDDLELAGCVYFEPRGERAYFGLLSIDPARQRAGLGKLLIAAVEEQARAAGCRFMDLQTVNLRTELPPFYRRLGYRETGTAPFPAEVKTKMPCHFILMAKPLDGPVS
jgi:N-acetylglutamate synthase-like GNAT family acetyltransferase